MRTLTTCINRNNNKRGIPSYLFTSLFSNNCSLNIYGTKMVKGINKYYQGKKVKTIYKKEVSVVRDSLSCQHLTLNGCLSIISFTLFFVTLLCAKVVAIFTNVAQHKQKYHFNPPKEWDLVGAAFLIPECC